MNNPIHEIQWEEKSDVIDALMMQDISLDIAPLVSGLEAEVTKISANGISCVLKVWNRDSKPDIRRQFKLLELLYYHGLSVSRPLGWGYDLNRYQVLLTPFDGVSLTKLDAPVLRQLAKILTDIHKLPMESELSGLLLKHDFMYYFYPAIDEHEDIKNLLVQLIEHAELNHDSMIHGDFNLGNILELEGEFRVIDWTNGQLGDARYDIAWSVILMRIYAGNRNGSVYRNAVLSYTSYSHEELELFEAIACLRWVLLSRVSNLPKGKDTVKRVKSILEGNKYLTDDFI
ncbi:aminoglycoside phosphotransferase family protein [Neobacillus mesonae]|nr:aminoglycoside phosphotransferase family protein [Neobacillus mesonae]